MEKVMKEFKIKNLFFGFFILLSSLSKGQELQKCPAYPDTIEIIQPGNYVLKCLMKGDEYSSIMTTVDGYPLIENKASEIEYAIIDSIGNINSSGIIAKNNVDRTLEELNFLKTIDKKSVSEIRKKTSELSPNGSSKLSHSIKSFPNSGTRNLLVLLIDFTDRPFQIGNNDFDNLMNQTNYNGTGSFSDFWLESSYNNLTVNSTIGGWYHAANNMAFYGANSSGSDTNPRLLVQEAVDAAENAGMDFSIFDNDNDGNVDGIIVIHSGYGEEAGGGANTIWSHHWTLGSYKRTYDGVIIDDYAIVPELRNNFGSNISNIGVICHEFGHSLGLPDLYDTDASNGDSEGIGEWGLMGSGNWNNNGASPSNLCAWSKVFLNWSNPVVLSTPSSISLPNSAQNNILYRVNTPHANEYFLIENRQFVGFDVGLPGTGLAIWHINTSKTTTAHIDNNDVNADETLKGVDLEEADGRTDLDDIINRGDNGDLFPGTSCNFSFDDSTIPNSQTYSPVVNANKPILDIVESGTNIRFDFMGYTPISGSSTVCTSGTSFTIENLPTGSTVTWGQSSNLAPVSSQGSNPCTFTSTSSGTGWIEAIISTTCGNITFPRKTVWAGKVLPLGLQLTDRTTGMPKYMFCNGQANPVKAVHADGEAFIDEWDWDVTGGYIYYDNPYDDNSEVTIYPTSTSLNVKVNAHNDCGWSGWADMGVGVVSCFSYFMSISPNPSSGETTITIESTSEGSKSFDPLIEWEMEVFTQGQQLKEKKNKLKGKTCKINTQGWKEGVYVVRARYDGEIITGKLIVE